MNWSLRKALSVLIGSCLLTLLFSFWGFFHYKTVKKRRILEEKYQLAYITQTGPIKEALKTDYLAELLGVSQDRKISLYALDLKKGEEKLLASPVIAKAKLKRVPPNTLYIDYEARVPIARLADYENTAIDKEGYIFPISPFFSPKELPEIYLGLPPFGEGEDPFERKGGSWKEPLKGRYVDLAMNILHFLEGSSWKEGLKVKKIDVSNAFAASLGQKEAVLFTEEELFLYREGKEIVFTFPKILRLMPKDFSEQLTHFSALRKTMIEDYKKQMAAFSESRTFSPRIVDLRIPKLAFVENR